MPQIEAISLTGRNGGAILMEGEGGEEEGGERGGDKVNGLLTSKLLRRMRRDSMRKTRNTEISMNRTKYLKR
eukprot:PDM64119.1 hypothetical protein PRIPAC_54363 [Pristionchus pacificus]